MDLIEIQETIPKLGSGCLPRSEGLHLTTVIKSFLEQAGIEQKKAAGWDMDVAAAAGFLFEEALEVAFRDLMSGKPRIGEIEKDGIIMSPDGLDIECWSLEEYKLTWKSSNHDVRDNHKWMMQIKGYCYALQTTECLLRVFYINGNYRGSGPQYKVFRLTFTPGEIAENWALITAHAETMR